MINETISLGRAIDVLNRALEADPQAMRNLVETRVRCNEALADDPTIQVMREFGGFSVGFLGVLNGIFGTDGRGWGTIAAEFEIICPNGHELPDCATGNHRCKECGEELQSGELLEFYDLERRVL
jgi:hypothetical protein